MPASLAPREHAKLVRGVGDRLVILLEHIVDFTHRGVYGELNDIVPSRYLALSSGAAESLRRIERDYPEVFHFSDIFRNASGSRGRRRKNKAKRGRFTGKLPGSSGHGFGESMDHDLLGDKTTGRAGNLERLRVFLNTPKVTKAEYDELWKFYGWYCHRDGPDRGNHDRGSEWWHFNYFGDDPQRWLRHSGRTTAGGLEAKIQAMHGPFTLDREGIEEHLERLGYSDVEEFQQDWTLDPDNVAGPVTQRALLYVGAELRDAKTGQALDESITFP